MAEIIGLPEPAPEGATALVPGAYDGQTVFVTGGGTGLGKAIATEFARLGANLVIASRKPEHLEAGQAAIEATGAEVLVVGCDIRQAEQIAEAFDAATERFAMPDVLINNAAANFPVPAEDMSANAWRTVVDITLNGTFFCAREFARRHLAAGTTGSIVNIGASYAWTGGPGFAPLGRGQGRGQVDDREPGRGMGSIRHPGEWPSARAVSPRGHDRRYPLQPRPHPREGSVPARYAGGAAAGTGLGGHFLGLPFRPVHQRPHHGGGRGQLAASFHDQSGGRHHPRPDGQGAIRSFDYRALIAMDHA